MTQPANPLPDAPPVSGWDPAVRRNVVFNTLGEGLWGLQAGMVTTATVFTVLLRQFGADETTIGSLSAIETGAFLVPQIFGLYLFNSRRRRKKNLLRWHLACIIPFIFLIGGFTAGSPHLSAPVVRWSLLACFLLFSLGIGIVLASWTDWQAHLYDVKIRGTVMGIERCCAATAGTAGSLLAGFLIHRFHSPQDYAWLYFLAGGLSLFSIAALWHIRDPDEINGSGAVKVKTAELWQRAWHSLQDANFRAFLLGRLLATAGFCIMPFITIYYTSPAGGGLTNAMVVTAGAAATFGGALGGLGMGRLGDRHGHRLGMLAGILIQILTLGVILLGQGGLCCLVVFTLAGLGTTGSYIAHANLTFETCPHDHRAAHIVVGNLVMGCVGIVVSLAAGWLAGRWGVRALFLVCLGINLTALGWVLLHVREPRTTVRR